MIVLYNPLSTTPGKQPLPLSMMALAAVLEDRHPWTLVDGNLVGDPAREIIRGGSDGAATIRSGAPRSKASLAAQSTARSDSSEPSVPATIGLAAIARPP